jgi:hypothetical protein
VGGSLALARYRVSLEALESPDLPAYLAPTPRGAFGHSGATTFGLGRYRIDLAGAGPR